ncbi:MAG: type II toxin-antitoxin system PemK/MazF family toxin [Phreatobacter sp.]|uniref:type II toxin-antitoxin system PemK/MazF family toxin n=1 Tax=Phreatobacter sp. TaxID=1966341 RepID=UPI0027339B51|nr:type II toxin-antitoxin system PemK/MazF family toxin [Phreatobacter sp.]MDP2801895.1 type II toxin-antitoxin system PemK/MazF family toxin [Phreatobacter sp.]
MVVVVPFPFTDRLAERRRPAVVVSSDRLTALGYLWVAMITSIGRGDPDAIVPISELDGTGLSHRSFVRPSKIACIEPARILRVVGALPPGDMAAVIDRLHTFIGRASASTARSSRP